jgi:amidase
MSSDEDVGPPRELTPVFYGCFDWHSSVHGHWLLLRLLRLYPDAPFAVAAETALQQSFRSQRVAAEVQYIGHEQRASFERPYGVAWLLQLMAELREWDDPRARRWQAVLEPLESAYVQRMRDWLDKLAYPIRIGEHAQTAFAFALFLDWARSANDLEFSQQVRARSLAFYRNDVNCPMAYEPGGQDFLSPCLAEADLMRRILPPGEYAAWLARFLPGIPDHDSSDWLALAEVTDRTDGKLAHLDGLHLSRAWALEGMAAGLPETDGRRVALLAAARQQGGAGLAAVTGEHYEGGHWLGSFATYLVTRRGITELHVGRPKFALEAEAVLNPLALAEQRMKQRMARWEPTLNAVISLQSQSFEQLAAADRAQYGTAGHGPLAGLPVLVKDNIDVAGMATTAGSLALAGSRPGSDADLVRELRRAGLIVAGKTNLSEWANFRDDDSTSGWSGVDGLTRNAWDPSRTACGSSSGSAVAVAAGYVPFAVGTETNGSIVCPASYNGLVGIKPTKGLVSGRGIVPIASSQDTAGPMAYSVKAAALLLSAMEQPAGAGAFGPVAQSLGLDEARHLGRDYISGLTSDGLRGLRIGVIRSRSFGDGSEGVYQTAVQDLAAGGANLVDDLVFPAWPDGFWDASLEVLLYEFKHEIARYLASLPDERREWTLQDLIAFNESRAEEEMPWFGQSLFLAAQEKGGLEDPAYLEARAMVQAFTRSTLDGLLAEHELDLLVMPTNALPFLIDLIHGDTWHGGSSSMAAISGYPHITVPAGRLHGLPLGLSFVGPAFSEPVLIRAAYAYEQATRHATTLEGDDPWELERVFSEQAGD